MLDVLEEEEKKKKKKEEEEEERRVGIKALILVPGR